MGRTNIEIDNGLIREAMRVCGAKTKREAVDIALRRLVEKGDLYRSIRRLRGRLEWNGNVESWRRSRAGRPSEG